MRKILIIAAALLCAAAAGAQNIDSVLHQIETNNLTLKALREQAAADKLANRKGIALPDPEIEGGRLWGRPSAIGNRVDFSISQGIDLATLSGARLRQAKRMNELADLGLLTQRTAILLQARQLYVEAVYYSRLIHAMQSREAESTKLLALYKTKLNSGEISKIEYNKIALAHESLSLGLYPVGVERDALMSQLRTMNGGIELSVTVNAAYPPESAPAKTHNIEGLPVMIQARRETEVSEKAVGLARAEGLPQLKVGYMQERTLGQRYGGVTAGLSIPLWSNRNNVRAARAAASASAVRQSETEIRLREELRRIEWQVRQTAINSEAADNALRNNDNTELMRKALDAGEISLTDYLLDRQQLYDLQDKALAAERDYHLAMAQLMAFEL